MGGSAQWVVAFALLPFAACTGSASDDSGLAPLEASLEGDTGASFSDAGSNAPTPDASVTGEPTVEGAIPDAPNAVPLVRVPGTSGRPVSYAADAGPPFPASGPIWFDDSVRIEIDGFIGLVGPTGYRRDREQMTEAQLDILEAMTLRAYYDDGYCWADVSEYRVTIFRSDGAATDYVAFDEDLILCLDGRDRPFIGWDGFGTFLETFECITGATNDWLETEAPMPDAGLTVRHLPRITAYDGCVHAIRGSAFPTLIEVAVNEPGAYALRDVRCGSIEELSMLGPDARPLPTEQVSGEDGCAVLAWTAAVPGVYAMSIAPQVSLLLEVTAQPE